MAEIFILMIFILILLIALVISLFVPDHWFDWVEQKIFGLEDYDD